MLCWVLTQVTWYAAWPQSGWQRVSGYSQMREILYGGGASGDGGGEASVEAASSHTASEGVEPPPPGCSGAVGAAHEMRRRAARSPSGKRRSREAHAPGLLAS